jgi:hypothetical protein
MHFRFAPKATVGIQKSYPSVCVKSGLMHCNKVTYAARFFD